MFEWNLYYNGGFLRDGQCDTDVEALDEVKEAIEEYIEAWKMADAWHEDDDEDLFKYDIIAIKEGE